MNCLPRATGKTTKINPPEGGKRAFDDLGGPWWAVTGSNRRPSRCKRDALPTELTARRASAAPLANPFARRQPSHELRGVFPDFLEIARDRAGCAAPQGDQRTLRSATFACMGSSGPAFCRSHGRPATPVVEDPYRRRKSGARRG